MSLNLNLLLSEGELPIGSWVPRLWVVCCWFLPAGGVEEPLVIVHSWRRRQTHLLSISHQPSHLGTERPAASVRIFPVSSRSSDSSAPSVSESFPWLTLWLGRGLRAIEQPNRALFPS